MTTPLVSVCIPNYNYGHFIAMAVTSAFEQDYANIEVIVVDNASTDDSQIILSELKNKYNFIFEKNLENIGIVQNFNKCLDLANGDYVIFLSSDDIIKPQFISKCIELFSADNVGMVVAHCDSIDQHHNISIRKPFFDSSGIISGQEHARIFLMTGIYFPSQVLIKKSILEDLGGWNLKYPIFFDWYLWFGISLNANIGYITESLALYREHSDSASSASIVNMQMIFEKYLLKIDFSNKIAGNDYLIKFKDESIKKLAVNCMHYAASLLKTDQIPLAKKYFQMIGVFDPLMLQNDDYQMLNFCLNLKSTNALDIYLKIIENFDDYGTKRPFQLPQGSIYL